MTASHLQLSEIMLLGNHAAQLHHIRWSKSVQAELATARHLGVARGEAPHLQPFLDRLIPPRLQRG